MIEHRDLTDVRTAINAVKGLQARGWRVQAVIDRLQEIETVREHDAEQNRKGGDPK